MMSKNSDNLINELENFGLSAEESEVFLLLNSDGAKTALQLSRELKAARTRMYRVLERLIEKEMVRELEGELGKLFQAVNPAQLNKLVADKEVELAKLAASLSGLIPQLEEQRGTSPDKSEVVHYRGTAGLRQLVWNTLTAEDEIRIYEISDLGQYLGQQFAEKVRSEFLVRKIHTRQITNEKFFEGWTDISEYVEKYWQIRYIPEEKIKMRFELFIYNDVYGMLTYDAGELFGVEIHNPQLAEMQKQMFDYMWNQGTKMEVLDKKGSAKVVVE